MKKTFLEGIIYNIKVGEKPAFFVIITTLS